VRNVYLGRYVRTDGSVVEGPSVSELVAEANPALDAELRGALANSVLALGAIKAAGEAGTHYVQLLATGNAAGEALVMGAIDALVAQTRSIERAVAALELSDVAFEGSDSLDNPEAVFQ
jgi:putative iron-regulated protein